MHPETLPVPAERLSDYAPVKGRGLTMLGVSAIAAIGLVTVLQAFFSLQLIVALDAEVGPLAVAQLALIKLVANLLAGVLFIVWLWRAWTNASTVLRTHMSMGRGWTVGSWFVPLGNFVLPYLSVRDVVQASADHGYMKVALRVWWPTLLGAQLVVLPGLLLGEAELTLVVSQLLICVAALAAAVLIYAVSDAQDRRQGRKATSVWRMAVPPVVGLVLLGAVGALFVDLNPTPRPVAQEVVQIRPSAVAQPSPKPTPGAAVPPKSKITLQVPARSARNMAAALPTIMCGLSWRLRVNLKILSGISISATKQRA